MNKSVHLACKPRFIEVEITASIMKVTSSCFPEMLVFAYKTALCHNSKDRDMNDYRREILKSYTTKSLRRINQRKIFQEE
jgi:hypothetical protein